MESFLKQVYRQTVKNMVGWLAGWLDGWEIKAYCLNEESEFEGRVPYLEGLSTRSWTVFMQDSEKIAENSSTSASVKED